MKKFTSFWVVVLSALLLTTAAHSQIKKVAQTGLQFLKVDMSSRSAAMAGAYTMPGNDASAMFYNPAGIARMENNFDLFSSTVQWIADINYHALGVAKNFGGWGNFGVSMVFADYGDIEGTQVAANEAGYIKTGSVDVGAYVVGISYARSLTDRFSIGGQVKYAAQHLGSSLLVDGDPMVKNEVGGAAFDFGTIFYPGYHSLSIGMSLNNFSGQYKYEETEFQLPLTFRIGVAMDVMDLIAGEHDSPLLIAVDALHPRDYTERLHVGAEYFYHKMFAIRAGYKFNYDEESFSIGAGLNQEVSGVKLKLDYAYSDLGLFDAVNRFSLGIAF
ncbi:MAG: PorV/PorQ family protein [Calditrichaeota bacterium]|nr:PorV/PorQ family protein [Calditrichota bacterium]HQU73449.1 PorV/PorQ family protein [Calditrichia bacterium]